MMMESYLSRIESMQLPEDFIERIKTQFPEDWEELVLSIDKEPITSIRYNPKKIIPHLSGEKIPWAENGYYLEQRPKFTFDPLFHAGAYYVQESSSMFIDFILKKLKTKISLDRVLDLCASPGGKSTIVMDHLEDHQYLVSNEIIPKRNNVLRENLTKWGRPNFLVSQNKSGDFEDIKSHFDLILLDAPCSGEGLFRKDKNAIEEWSVNNASMCSERQYDIFHHVWNSLKDGGYMIYSTCTYNPDENENFIARLLSEGANFVCDELDIDPSWNIHVVRNGGVVGYQFLPQKVKGEGFFCTILRKNGDYKCDARKKTNSQINPIVFEFLSKDSSLEDYSSFKFENKLFLVPNFLLDNLNFYKAHLYLRQIGIEIAEENHGMYHPSHGLAMLAMPYCPDKSQEVSKSEALQFLSKETFDLGAMDNGFYLLNYEGIPLGFIKQIGNRHNNYYPKNWRILTDWRKGIV